MTNVYIPDGKNYSVTVAEDFRLMANLFPYKSYYYIHESNTWYVRLWSYTVIGGLNNIPLWKKILKKGVPKQVLLLHTLLN